MTEEGKDVLTRLAAEGDKCPLDIIIAAVVKAIAIMSNHLQNHEEDWDKLSDGPVAKLHALGTIPLAAVVFLSTSNALSSDDRLRDWAQHVFTATIEDIGPFSALISHMLQEMQQAHDDVAKSFIQ